MVNRCPNCNEKIVTKSKFCPNCGVPLESEETSKEEPGKPKKTEAAEGALISFSQPVLIVAAVLGTTAILGWVSVLVFGQFGWAWLGLLLAVASMIVALILLRRQKQAPTSIKIFVWGIIVTSWLSIIVSFFLLVAGCQGCYY